jgi:hypothetical protein
MTFKIIDNALPEHLCVMTHRFATSSDQWFDAGSDLIKDEVKKDHSTFPIMPVVKDNNFVQFHPLAGFYMCIGQLIAESATKVWGYDSYDTDLQRVHLVAHRPGESGLVVPHKDYSGDYLSAVYHLSSFPWKPHWGGDTVVEDKTIDFVPNRIVTFRSDTEHYGTPPSPKCPHVRVVLNVVFKVN